MRTLKFLQIFLACTSVCATSTTVLAQTQPEPSPAPPPLEKLNEAEDPNVTITSPDSERTVTEKRRQGKVVEVKVKSGKSTYYLKPNTPAGSALPGDVQTDPVRAPQWKIMEFGPGEKKADPKDAASTLPPPPPPESTSPAK